jgi:hypothetical protein
VGGIEIVVAYRLGLIKVEERIELDGMDGTRIIDDYDCYCKPKR